VLGVLLYQVLVATDARVMVHVSGLGHADYRLDKEVGLYLTRSAEGNLLMRPVHRVTGLEGDYLSPSEFLELGPKLGGGVTKLAEVVVARKLKALQLTTKVYRIGVIHKITYARMHGVFRTVNF
jgi:hypothetical protein